MAHALVLHRLTVNQLRAVLQATGLPSSGSKEERIARIVAGFVPPAEVLDVLHINDVKSLCRDLGLAVSAAKADLIDGVVEAFEIGRDLQEASGEPADAPLVKEEKQLEPVAFRRLFDQLTVDQLYDLLTTDRLKRAGSKAERIERLLGGPLGETALLGELRRSDLVKTCRRLGVPVSGVKAELVERLIEWLASRCELTRAKWPCRRGPFRRRRQTSPSLHPPVPPPTFRHRPALRRPACTTSRPTFRICREMSRSCCPCSVRLGR